uniref:Uncharacterized protein n=1 Tax=Oryza sativa subsp. japonica TaxID=39947 RepID=Q6KAF4_ORYSJ|nr:hypothetical protein [Oryza sativa Japonica Group]
MTISLHEEVSPKRCPKEDATWIVAIARSEPKQGFHPENMVEKGKGRHRHHHGHPCPTTTVQPPPSAATVASQRRQTPAVQIRPGWRGSKSATVVANFVAATSATIAAASHLPARSAERRRRRPSPSPITPAKRGDQIWRRRRPSLEPRRTDTMVPHRRA